MSRYLAHNPGSKPLENENILPSRRYDNITSKNNGLDVSTGLDDNVHICSDGPYPTTPKLNLPNSGRKRSHTPGLSRSTITPSHSVQMSNIFHNAATSMRDYQTPSRHMSSNTKRSRIPLSQARVVQFGNMSRQGTPGNLHTNNPSSPQIPPSPTPVRVPTSFNMSTGFHLPTTPLYEIAPGNHHDSIRGNLEPISSGFAPPLSPQNNTMSSSNDVAYPTLYRSPNGSAFASNDDETHSTHGVPLIIAFPKPKPLTPQNPNINAWLNDIVDDPSSSPLSVPTIQQSSEVRKSRKPTKKSKILNALLHPIYSPSKSANRSPSPTSSNKENLSPSTAYLGSTLSKTLHPLSSPFPLPTNAAVPSSIDQPTDGGAASMFHAPRITPRVLKRNKAHVKAAGNENGGLMKDGKGFMKILEDEDVAKLSPGVERVRKGRGRGKKERCGSYWDRDILGGTGREDGEVFGGREIEEENEEDEDEEVVVREVRRGRGVLVEKVEENDKAMGAEFVFRA